MLGRIFTVGGYTSFAGHRLRARHHARGDPGAGPLADAFFVALRLPNHFRAIFAEGAFNAAFVPAYAHVHGERGRPRQAVQRPHLHPVVRIAGGAAGPCHGVHAAGDDDCWRRASPTIRQRNLAIELTRITFPYLLLITLVTLYGGMLNVMHRFASAAAAPIFLNLSMMATLALAAFFRPPVTPHGAC
jgi:putative peptidoglycan lipid II flippase